MRGNERPTSVRRFTIAATVAIGFGSLLIIVLLQLVVRPAGEASAGWSWDVLQLAASAVFAAAVTALVFSWLTLQETEEQTEAIVSDAIRDVFVPVREVLGGDALNHYRLDMHIAGAGGDSAHRDYARLFLWISYRARNIPSELRLVCLNGPTEEAFDGYRRDDRYLFRWLVDPELNPVSDDVFSVIRVSVDGVELPQTARSKSLANGTAAEKIYRTPRRFVGPDPRTIEMALMVREFMGDDRRLMYRTELFSNVTDAEYRCTTDRSLGVSAIWTELELASLGPTLTILKPPTFQVGGDNALLTGAIVRQPLQRGSSVTFVLSRDGASDCDESQP